MSQAYSHAEEFPYQDDEIDGLVREQEKRKRRESPSAGPILSDAKIIELARNQNDAEIVAEFIALFDEGDTSLDNEDHSAADYHLVRMLAYYTQDPEQLERLWEASVLASRFKFENRPDYRERTIERAIKAQSKAYRLQGGQRSSREDAPPPRRQVRVEQFYGASAPEMPEFMVEQLVPKEHLTILYGSGGVAKSTLAISLGIEVARGSDKWLGFGIEGGRVLYLDFELDSTSQHWRAAAVSEGAGSTVPPNFYYLSTIAHPRPRDAFTDAVEACGQYDIDLVILDSIGPALEGDMNSNRDVTAFFREMINPLREMGTTVFAVDHQGKLGNGERYSSKGAIGGSYKRNLARSMIQLEMAEREANYIKLKCRQNKANFDALAHPFAVSLLFQPGRVGVWREELTSAELAEEETLPAPHRVAYALDGYGDLTSRDIGEIAGLSRNMVIAILKKFYEMGKVEVVGSERGQKVFALVAVN